MAVSADANVVLDVILSEHANLLRKYGVSQASLMNLEEKCKVLEGQVVSLQQALAQAPNLDGPVGNAPEAGGN